MCESYDVQSVAADLWEALPAADAENVLSAFITADQHGRLLAVSLVQPHTWHTLASFVRHSPLKDAIVGCAVVWFTVLLLPGQFILGFVVCVL